MRARRTLSVAPPRPPMLLGLLVTMGRHTTESLRSHTSSPQVCSARSTSSLSTPMPLRQRCLRRSMMEQAERGVGAIGECGSYIESSASGPLVTTRRMVFSSFREMVQQSLRGGDQDRMSRPPGDDKKSDEERGSGDAGWPPHAFAARAPAERRPSRPPAHIRYNPQVCPRSALFVPGHKPRALLKALSGAAPADCFILDLEDSVGPGSKREAREGIRHFLEVDVPAWQEQRAMAAAEAVGAMDESDGHAQQGDDGMEGGGQQDPVPSPRFIVRVNSPNDDPTNALLDLDLISALGERIEGVGIPKVTPHSFNKIRDYLHPAHQLWAFFETPQSVLQAMSICHSGHYRAAVMGYNDLRTELQLTSPVTGRCGTLSEADALSLRQASQYPLWFAAMQVLYAARSVPKQEMFLLDGVFNDPTDPIGFAEDLRHGFALGFQGKTLIHPGQIRPTNAIFTPSAAEVEWAKEVVAAVAASKGNVASVRGKMVEGLHVRQAKRLLLLSESAAKERAEEQGEEGSASSSPINSNTNSHSSTTNSFGNASDTMDMGSEGRRRTGETSSRHRHTHTPPSRQGKMNHNK